MSSQHQTPAAWSAGADVSLRLTSYIRRHRSLLRPIIGWGLLSTLPTFAGGRLAASAVDAVITEGLGSAVALLLVMAALGVLGSVAGMRLGRSAGDLVEEVRAELTMDIVAGALSAAVHLDRKTGQGGSELNEQVETVRESFSGALRFLPQMLGGLAATAGLATLTPLLALVVLPFLAVGWLFLRSHVRRVAVRTRTDLLAREERLDTAGRIFEGVRDVMAYRAHEQAGDEIDRRLDDAKNAAVALNDATSVGSLLISLSAVWAPMFTVLALLPWFVSSGRLSVGEAFGAVFYLQAGFMSLVFMLNMMVQTVITITITLARLREQMHPLPDRVHGGSTPAGSDIDVDRLSFSFAPEAQNIVHELSVALPAGDHLAIVGPSGIGKSTFVSLLVGMLEPTNGRVLIGGVPVTSLDDNERARHVVMVPQESYVFSGTLRDNLTYLAPDATDEEILAAADEIGLGRVLERLGGLDGLIDTTTSGLSEGQRQLITLARMYLAPAPIVVLDEATCYLDPVAEEQVERAFAQRHGTLIVIAHRMSSSLRARRILVMDGDVPSIGTHDELLAKNALYADLHGLWAAEYAGNT